MQMRNDVMRRPRRLAALVLCGLPCMARAQYATGLVSDWAAVVLLGPWLLLIGVGIWAGCSARFAYRKQMLRAVFWPMGLFIVLDASLITTANLSHGPYTEPAFAVALYLSLLSGPLLLIVSSVVFAVAVRLKRPA